MQISFDLIILHIMTDAPVGEKVRVIDAKELLEPGMNKPWYKIVVNAFCDELLLAKVDVCLNTEYTQQVIDEFQPDAIAFATGAQEIKLRIPGAELPHVFTASEVLRGAELPGTRGAIIGGGQVGVETAELLQQRGHQITVVEMLGAVLTKMGSVGKKMLLESVMRQGLNVWVNSALKEIHKDGIVVDRLGQMQFLPCDYVIMSIGYRPIPIETRQEIPVYQIGDSAKVANIFEATAQAYELARTI